MNSAFNFSELNSQKCQPEYEGLITVKKVVLNMSHLVVCGDQMLHCHLCTLLDPDKHYEMQR